LSKYVCFWSFLAYLYIYIYIYLCLASVFQQFKNHIPISDIDHYTSHRQLFACRLMYTHKGRRCELKANFACLYARMMPAHDSKSHPSTITISCKHMHMCIYIYTLVTFIKLTKPALIVESTSNAIYWTECNENSDVWCTPWLIIDQIIENVCVLLRAWKKKWKRERVNETWAIF
jgi:hypothetical protein